MTTNSFPTRRQIAAEQLVRLRRLLAVLTPGNAFWTPRLQAAGLNAQVASLDEFGACLGLTNKAELIADQLAHPPYGSNLTFPLEDYTRYWQTSGTTATPMRWLDTPAGMDWMVANWSRVFEAAGVGRGDRVYFAFSFGPFLGFWTAYEAAVRRGCLALPGGGLSTAGRLRAMLDNRVTTLCCTPTYALRLGQTAREQGLDLAGCPLRCLIVGGEPGGSVPAVRRQLERFFPQARVHDHHGMTEVGPVTFECPRCPGTLHVMEPAFLPEVLDPHTGSPTPAGSTGELVLTTLGREGSPLLRYRTGDLVRPAAETVCPCGRADLALVGGILGRADDMVIIRGVNVFPSAVEDVIRRFPEVVEYRVEVGEDHGLTHLAVSIELAPDAAAAADLARNLEAAMAQALSLRVPVTLVEPNSLPRFEMKARRWVRV